MFKIKKYKKNLCPVCDSDSISAITVATDLSYTVCQTCSHCEKTPRSGDLRGDFVVSQANYYEDPAHDPFKEPEIISQEKLQPRLAVARRFLKADSRLLEVGPGGGAFLEWACAEGYNCTGCEQSVSLSNALLKKGFSIINFEFEALNVEESYDAVASFHIIEHVPNPLDHLRRAFECVRPGGHLIIATPNSRCWQQRLAPTQSVNFDAAHLHVFSSKSLTKMAETAGWQRIWHATPENSAGWLRLVARIFRKVRGEDTNVTAGKYSNMGTSGALETAVKVFAILSQPFRFLQSKMNGGSEILCVFVKPLGKTQS
jgi:2-polyprenyl-3-methyl-5-hydroxy-6-metoxy-1,4-benzoquinol methylase